MCDSKYAPFRSFESQRVAFYVLIHLVAVVEVTGSDDSSLDSGPIPNTQTQTQTQTQTRPNPKLENPAPAPWILGVESALGQVVHSHNVLRCSTEDCWNLKTGNISLSPVTTIPLDWMILVATQ